MENEKKLTLKRTYFVEVFTSKKGAKCACLKVDLGYAKRALTFDTALVAEVLGVSVADLMSYAVGQYNV